MGGLTPKVYLWTNAHPAALRRVFPHLYAAADEGRVAVETWSGADPPDGKGTVTLALGGAAVDGLRARGLGAKRATIASLRGRPFALPGGGVALASYSPGLVDLDYGFLYDLRWDGVLALRLATTGSTKAKLGTYRRVSDLGFLVRRVKKRYARTGKPVPVNHDLEWVGASPWHEDFRILASIFATDPGRAYVVLTPNGTLTPALRRQHRWLLRSKKVALGGSNHKGDSHALALKWGIERTNLAVDTVLAGNMLEENRSNGLNQLTKEYAPELGGYDDEHYATYDPKRMDLVPDADMVRYGGGDGDATTRVRAAVTAGLNRDKRLRRLYRTIVHPAALAFERIERNGVVVDLDEYRRLKKTLGRKDGTKGLIPEKLREFEAMLPPKIRAKYADNPRPSRPALVMDLFFHPVIGLGLTPVRFSEKDRSWIAQHPKLERKWRARLKKNPEEGPLKNPSTSIKEHLIRFYADERARPYIDLMREIASAAKTRETYVDGWLTHLRPDGKFHPTYFLFKKGGDKDDGGGGTTTGRTSAKDPSIQTLPKRTKWAKPLRRCFPAPPGMALAEWDFIQGELRIAACLSHEPTMLDAYRAGEDLHAITAADLNGMTVGAFKALEGSDPSTYEWMRTAAKAGNFGLLYGMGAEGFMLYAFSSFGLVLTYAQAAEIRERFFALYAGLGPWHERQRRIAHRLGYVRSPLGRVRHLPMIHARDSGTRSKAERQSINSPVQSTLSDLCLWAIAELDRRFRKAPLQLVGMTHDSILGYVPAAEAPKWAAEVKGVMEGLPIRRVFGWDHPIPFPVDAEVSYTNLAEMQKVAA